MVRSLPTRHATRALASALFAALALFAIAGRPHADTGEHYTITGTDVALYDLTGAVKLEAGTGNSVGVQITRGGSDASRLEVETGPIGVRQTLRVRYPSNHIRYRDLDFGGSSSLNVKDDGTFGDRSEGSEGHRVTISRSGDFEAWADLNVTVPRGQHITLHLAVGSVIVSNVDGELFIDTSASPVSTTGTRGKLGIDTGSGSVTVLGAQGDVNVDTGSGSVNMSGVHGGAVSLDTGSGRVSVDDAKVDRLHVDTGSGSVGVRALQAPDVDLDTGSGGIDIDLASDVESLLADTGSGHITLSVPRSLGATFEATSSSGGIEIEVPHESSYTDHDEARGRIGDGRGRIRLESGSGSVRIRPRTSGGSSLLMLPGPVLRNTLE